METQKVTLRPEDVDALEEAGYALARLPGVNGEFGNDYELMLRVLALTLRIRSETGWQSRDAENVVPIR